MRIALLIAVSIGLATFPASAQRGGGGGRARAAAPGAENPAADEKPDPGIPVTNALVISKCSGCHKKDDAGNLSRISWERSTPEGWEEAIKRMVRLNGLTITPPEARQVVKYLATYHGLAPEEAKPVMYFAEHRIQDEPVPTEGVRTACMGCHAMAKPLSWRRSKDDWKLLTNLHVAMYAQAEAAFRRPNFGGAAARVLALLLLVPRSSRSTRRSIICRKMLRSFRRNGPRGRRVCGLPSSPDDGWCRPTFRVAENMSAKW